MSPEIVPGRRILGRIAGLFTSASKTLVTDARDALQLGFEGIEGDKHAGFTRRADARVPHYPRGTPIRNVRQLSIVSIEELAEIAEKLTLPAMRAEWLGANVVTEGIPRLSFLPTGTRLFFTSAAALVAEGYNPPCVLPGKIIQAETGRVKPQAFVKAAARRRGIVACVERPGTVFLGDAVTIVVPDQWIY